MKNICIIYTGTVASTLYLKINQAFADDGYKVTSVFTEHGGRLTMPSSSNSPYSKNRFSDIDEWEKYVFTSHPYMKGDTIKHIEISKANNSLLVIASADFISKMANGICDDLASSVYRAWNRGNPVVVAPAMNTHMWMHPVTSEHIAKLNHWSIKIVPPVSKKLACGDEGVGALADIKDIKAAVDNCYKNVFPIANFNGIPVGNHPGAFLTQRKHAKHTGVDLYTNEKEPVFPMNDGIVISIEDFTGKFDGSSWWEDTRCVLVEHWFGVVCYGELSENPCIKVGDFVSKGKTCIGFVERVLKPGKERPDISGHSLSMLHVELYPHGQKKASMTYANDKEILIDPTGYLIESCSNPKLLTA